MINSFVEKEERRNLSNWQRKSSFTKTGYQNEGSRDTALAAKKRRSMKGGFLQNHQRKRLVNKRMGSPGRETMALSPKNKRDEMIPQKPRKLKNSHKASKKKKKKRNGGRRKTPRPSKSKLSVSGVVPGNANNNSNNNPREIVNQFAGGNASSVNLIPHQEDPLNWKASGKLERSRSNEKLRKKREQKRLLMSVSEFKIPSYPVNNQQQQQPQHHQSQQQPPAHLSLSHNDAFNYHPLQHQQPNQSLQLPQQQPQQPAGYREGDEQATNFGNGYTSRGAFIRSQFENGATAAEGGQNYFNPGLSRKFSYGNLNLSYLNRIFNLDFRTENGTSFDRYLRECKEDLSLALKARQFMKNSGLLRPPVRLKRDITKRKTLLLDLDETLIHAEDFNPLRENLYDVILDLPIPHRANPDTIGVFIRPYAREFLRRMSTMFELIVFTAGRKDYADRMLNMLDPNREFISHRLYRHHCTQFQGICVKDFRIISNRRSEDMVMVDNYIYSFSGSLENGIPIKPYLCGKEDYELEYLADKLQTMKKLDDCATFLEDNFNLHHFYKYLITQRI